MEQWFWTQVAGRTLYLSSMHPNQSQPNHCSRSTVKKRNKYFNCGPLKLSQTLKKKHNAKLPKLKNLDKKMHTPSYKTCNNMTL